MTTPALAPTARLHTHRLRAGNPTDGQRGPGFRSGTRLGAGWRGVLVGDEPGGLGEVESHEAAADGMRYTGPLTAHPDEEQGRGHDPRAARPLTVSDQRIEIKRLSDQDWQIRV